MRTALWVMALCALVHADEPTQRIASFSPAATRILADLGCTKQIVSVTRWCELPDGHSATRTCDAFEPDVEALLKSGATLAVLPRLANPLLANRIRSAGIHTTVLSEESPESPAKDIHILGEITGRLSESKKLLAARTVFKNAPSGKRVLIVWDGVCAGPLSYLSWAIRAAGAEPAPLQGAWPTWDIEEVVRSKPDIVIFLQTSGPAKVELDKMNLEKWGNLPGLKSTPAAKNGSIFHLKPNTDWLPASGQPEVAKIIAGLIGN